MLFSDIKSQYHTEEKQNFRIMDWFKDVRLVYVRDRSLVSADFSTDRVSS